MRTTAAIEIAGPNVLVASADDLHLLSPSLSTVAEAPASASLQYAYDATSGTFFTDRASPSRIGRVAVRQNTIATGNYATPLWAFGRPVLVAQRPFESASTSSGADAWGIAVLR